MDALLALGAVIVLVTATDVFLTVVHPTRQGPLSHVLNRVTFHGLRALGNITGRSSLLSPAGPLSLLAVMGTWIVLFWVGYALIYLPNMDRLHFTPNVGYDGRQFVEALYFSGMALTTVGFGDVVGSTDLYRIVSVLEAATGFGVFTAAVTYVLSIYPTVTAERLAARTVQTCDEDASRAAEMARGEPFLLAVQNQLIALDEHTERFPLLYYFHSEDRQTSKYTFLRGVAMISAAARWALAPDRVHHARRWGRELQESLERTMHHYAERFMGGASELERGIEREEARRRLARLVKAAGDNANPAILDDDAEVDEFGRFAGRCDAFLEHLAFRHMKEHHPIGER